MARGPDSGSVGAMSIVQLAPPRGRRTPTDLILDASLVVAPLVYLLADCLYAARGWADADAGGVHVIGALLYGFVLLRLAAWSHGWLSAGMLVAAMVGTAGNVAYGFNTIHVSLGGVDLVDTSGPGALIKPLGLVFPVALFLGALTLRQVGRRPSAFVLAVCAGAWPVAHIGNVAWLAVLTNALLVAALVPLAWAGRPASTSL